jgi:hypothetical protein
MFEYGKEKEKNRERNQPKLSQPSPLPPLPLSLTGSLFPWPISSLRSLPSPLLPAWATTPAQFPPQPGHPTRPSSLPLHRSAPFFFPLSPFLPRVQWPPKLPASFSSGPARRGLDPRPLTGSAAPTYLCPNPSRHRRPQRRLLLFFRRANTLGLPWAGRSAAPQATATPARDPPRRLELPQAGN